MTDDRTKQDWANYRRFINHKNALNMIFNHRPEQPLRPYCQVCGWCKGGLDSWDGVSCKCGHNEPPIKWIDDNKDAQYDVDRAADEEGVSVAHYLTNHTE